MNSHNQNGWPPGGPVPGPPPPGAEQQQIQQRTPGNFAPQLPLQQPPQHQVNGPPLIPQPTSFFSSQSNGHSLPNPATLPPQASPMQNNRGVPPPPSQQQSPTSLPHPPPQAHYGLPALAGPSTSHQSPQAAMQADLDHQERLRREQAQAMREQEIAQRYEQEVNRQREEQREILTQERQQREQMLSPRENHVGTLPLQQPVANRVTGSLHGPNGILNEQHLTSPPHAQPAQPSGAPSGPGNVFSSNLPRPGEQTAQSFSQQVPPPITQQQQHLLHLTAAAAPQQVNGVATLNQQQPILNDALSYLDQVKVQFQDQPDVYNRFLDIMKDFKSQAIDTPGVIDRVSQLFTGHPGLIQGFNTFLPPGYRIDIGMSDDPNAIRVTTPMGTTIQQMPAPQNRLAPNGIPNIENAGAGLYPERQPLEWAAQQQELDQQENAAMAARQTGAGMYPSQPQGTSESFIEEQMQADAQALPPGLASNQQFLGNLEKRGPVEFNHAIGYVNKIKNRFASQPEIYKQFLEILQTYQRESKPIQDVYAQVTQLFNAAPDLLEDFKQFLPESAAQAKAQAREAREQYEQAAMTSNVRGAGDLSHATGALRTSTQTPRPGDSKMPPMGTFPTPSMAKDNKKRRGGPGSTNTGGANAADLSFGGNTRNRGNANTSNKRQRVDPAKPSLTEAPQVSPGLAPPPPHPLPPETSGNSVSEGVNFFERVRRHLSNRQVFNEFLKLCNLFNNMIIDKDTLVQKVHGYIGGNPDLFNWFKNWIQYDGVDKQIENTARISSGKVALSTCRGYGPSYRLLPRREALRPCSGRDELCWKVLNDDWVSHPTWASEESGFIAHRKNMYEESLHRIEEERHDYDINIEACTRTIQLLEPIAQQLLMMSEDERSTYRLPPGIGGQSETIYQRVIKKIYGRDHGTTVINDMFRNPNAVVGILLGRLKQKEQEWKASQREWEKVWHAQTGAIFWKSLDHQGISIKSSDKRQFQPKNLQAEIAAKYDEQRRQRMLPWSNVPRYQFKYDFSDTDVLYDACHLVLTSLHNGFQANDTDKSRLETLIKTFIPTFFEIDRDVFLDKMNDIEASSPRNKESDEDNTDADSAVARGRRNGNGKKTDLLRGVLDRSKQQRDGGDESGATTPDVQSNDEETPASAATATQEQPRADPNEHRWLSHPMGGNETADLNVPFKRDDFHLYATPNIYYFFRLFQALYERLMTVKNNEERVHHDVSRAQTEKPANQLGVADKAPSEYFTDVSRSANYYKQIFAMCEDVIKGDTDNVIFEDTLRRFYTSDGWTLYSVDRMLNSLLRFVLNILISDNKDKSLDIINLFYKDRNEDMTTHQNELTYRKQVEKLGKDFENIYRIRYNRPSHTAYLQIFKKDDKTFEADELAANARWSYYVSTYCMLDHTEGIPHSSVKIPYLRRNMPFPPLKRNEEGKPTVPTEDLEIPGGGMPSHHHDGLVLRIAPNNYRILYDPGTDDWFIQSTAFRKRGLDTMEQARRRRHAGLKRLLESQNENSSRFEKWMKYGPDALRDESTEGMWSTTNQLGSDTVMAEAS